MNFFWTDTFLCRFIDYMECDIDYKDISKLNKDVDFETTFHELSLPFVTIFYQEIFGSLVLKLIINFMMVQVSWMVTGL